MATATSAAAVAAQRFLDALADGDFDQIGACFAETGKLQALVPSGLREDDGPEAIAARLRLWFGDVLELEVVESGIDEFHDLAHLRYRVSGDEDGPVIVEQHAYVKAAADGQIEAMNLVCSGFKPR